MLAACSNFKPPSPSSTTPSPPPSLSRPLPTIDPPDSRSWDDLAQRYLQLAAQYGQCVVERAGLVQAGRRE
ncbi:Rz1-like lysis system protein LysC [Aquitalea pelogenes]|uniref:Rz1-like lysis system protein LysC n=1 Tax=Aquitalea pelogenes TaxID=1293573 RepID=UPI004040024D